MPTDDPSNADDLITTPAPPRPEDAVTLDDVADDADRRRRFPFRRNTTDRYLAGIAGGEGRRLGIDPFYLRIALVGVTLVLARNGSDAFLIPLLAYLAAWLFWPTEADRSLVRRFRDRPAKQEVGGAIVATVLAIVVIGRPSLIWAGILLGAAVALLGHREPGLADDDPLGSPSSARTFTDPTAASAMTPEEQAVSWGRSLRGAIGPRSVERQSRPVRVRPPRRSPALWPLTASLLFAYGFACVLLDNLLDPGIDPGLAVNGAILVIGGVITLSSWRGRAMLTSLLLVPLAPAWVAFSVANTPRFADTGAPARSSEGYVDGQVIEQSQGYGSLVVRLDADDLPDGGEVTAKVGLTAGQIDLWLPRDAALRIEGHVGLGQIEVYEERYWNSYDSDPLVDYRLNRTYAALGRTCFTTQDSEIGMRNTAEWSGLTVASDASGGQVAAAITRAGYPAPTSDTITEYDGYYEDEDGVTYDNFGEAVQVDAETGAYERVVWTYQVNENGGLCLPEPPPAKPVLITIDATIGLGNLKVHRV